MPPVPPPTAPQGAAVEGSAGPSTPPPPPLPRRWTRRHTGWLVAGGVAAGCAYLAIADPNQSSSWYPQCPFKALTGLDCPGCGVTRALRALVTGHPGRALDHNALFVVVAVVAVVWLAANAVRSRRGRPPLRVRHAAAWSVAAGVALVAFWVLRNVRWGPFGWLAADAAGA